MALRHCGTHDCNEDKSKMVTESNSGDVHADDFILNSSRRRRKDMGGRTPIVIRAKMSGRGQVSRNDRVSLVADYLLKYAAIKG